MSDGKVINGEWVPGEYAVKRPYFFPEYDPGADPHLPWAVGSFDGIIARCAEEDTAIHVARYLDRSLADTFAQMWLNDRRADAEGE